MTESSIESERSVKKSQGSKEKSAVEGIPAAH